jgi:hypothetical protein
LPEFAVIPASRAVSGETFAKVENSAMRSNFTLGLVAAFLALGIAGSSADTVEPNLLAKGPAEPSNLLLLSKGTVASGFSALRAHAGTGLDANSFVSSDNTGAFHDALAATTDVFPSEAAAAKSAQQAEMLLPGVPAKSTGFAAIKAAAGKVGGSAYDLESLRSKGANPFTAPSK